MSFVDCLLPFVASPSVGAQSHASRAYFGRDGLRDARPPFPHARALPREAHLGEHPTPEAGCVLLKLAESVTRGNHPFRFPLRDRLPAPVAMPNFRRRDSSVRLSRSAASAARRSPRFDFGAADALAPTPSASARSSEGDGASTTPSSSSISSSSFAPSPPTRTARSIDASVLFAAAASVCVSIVRPPLALVVVVVVVVVVAHDPSRDKVGREVSVSVSVSV